MRIVAFVGPSGTGKSHRAQMVAREKNIDYIIDDAILVSQIKVVAGTSAKKASTKIESVKRALFSMPGQAEEMKEAIKKEKPKRRNGKRNWISMEEITMWKTGQRFSTMRP